MKQEIFMLVLPHKIAPASKSVFGINNKILRQLFSNSSAMLHFHKQNMPPLSLAKQPIYNQQDEIILILTKK